MQSGQHIWFLKTRYCITLICQFYDGYKQHDLPPEKYKILLTEQFEAISFLRFLLIVFWIPSSKREACPVIRKHNLQPATLKGVNHDSASLASSVQSWNNVYHGDKERITLRVKDMSRNEGHPARRNWRHAPRTHSQRGKSNRPCATSSHKQSDEHLLIPIGGWQSQSVLRQALQFRSLLIGSFKAK